MGGWQAENAAFLKLSGGCRRGIKTSLKKTKPQKWTLTLGRVNSKLQPFRTPSLLFYIITWGWSTLFINSVLSPRRLRLPQAPFSCSFSWSLKASSPKSFKISPQTLWRSDGCTKCMFSHPEAFTWWQGHRKEKMPPPKCWRIWPARF